MIENFHQYAVTRDAVDKFEEALILLNEWDSLHPLIRKAQRDGIVSVLKELTDDMKVYEDANLSGSLVRKEMPAGLAFHRLFKNLKTHGRSATFSTFSMLVTEHGVCVNGDYGTNPNRQEMMEMLCAMRELVADWDKRYGDIDSVS